MWGGQCTADGEFAGRPRTRESRSSEGRIPLPLMREAFRRRPERREDDRLAVAPDATHAEGVAAILGDEALAVAQVE
jgi:hypothetical protein